MRAFVTGGSGFVGSHLVKILRQAQVQVAVLARPTNPLMRLQNSLTEIRVITGDLANISAFLPQLRDFHPDVCFHLAWYAEPENYLYSPENLPALTNSLSLLQALIDIGCPQVVMTGTCAEYDTSFGFLREDTPTRPTTIYAAAKLGLATVAQQMAKDAHMDLAWARLFHMYGAQEDDRRMIPALIKSLLQQKPFDATPGGQVRDYLYVEDVANALWHIYNAGLTGIVNVSSANPVTIRQIMEAVGKLTGNISLINFGAKSYRDWEPMFICGDNQKLRTTGWKPQFTLHEGLSEAVRWWREQLEC